MFIPQFLLRKTLNLCLNIQIIQINDENGFNYIAN